MVAKRSTIVSPRPVPPQRRVSSCRPAGSPRRGGRSGRGDAGDAARELDRDDAIADAAAVDDAARPLTDLLLDLDA